MKIVLTNDDGIDAPGMAALYEIARHLGRVVVVAPVTPQSGVGHRVTTGSPLKVDETGPDRFAVAGTPADCVRIALKTLAADADWVIAGINAGANLGSDVYQSGTVAAAREAAILGRRGAAVSQYIARDHDIDWPTTGHHAGTVLKKVMALPLERAYFWNINLPHPLAMGDEPGHRFCGIDPHPHAYHYLKEGAGYLYRGDFHARPRDPGKDVAVCLGGQISVTRIALETTGYRSCPL